MKRTVTLFALISLVASAAALADSDERHRRGADSRHKYESSREYQRDDRRYRHGHSYHRRDDRHQLRHQLRHQPRYERRYVPVRKYHPPHGYYYKKWHRGDRLPRGYYARQYVLHDHHVYRLHAPPRGYHWVRVNHDVVLAAIATGVVLEVLYGHFD